MIEGINLLSSQTMQPSYQRVSLDVAEDESEGGSGAVGGVGPNGGETHRLLGQGDCHKIILS